jgi:hypothetical protein
VGSRTLQQDQVMPIDTVVVLALIAVNLFMWGALWGR